MNRQRGGRDTGNKVEKERRREINDRDRKKPEVRLLCYSLSARDRALAQLQYQKQKKTQKTHKKRQQTCFLD